MKRDRRKRKKKEEENERLITRFEERRGRGLEKLVVNWRGVPFRISGLCVVFVRDLGCAVENPPEGVVGVAPGVLGLLPPGV